MKFANYEVLKWNAASLLPSPNEDEKPRFWLKLANGSIVQGTRRSYIASRSDKDLGYRDMKGNVLDVVEWSHM